MAKIFNITGACTPARHYMVDLESRLKEIGSMVDAGEYFSITKARQYGKTTTLRALAGYLRQNYLVISLDFQRMSSADFENESSFVNGLAREIVRVVRRMKPEMPDSVERELKELAGRDCGYFRMAEIFDFFSEWCEETEKPIVLIIDEADTASNNQIFLDFLAQLRAAYLDRDRIPAFQSVILAGIYDIRNIRRRIRPEEEHKTNSPWNIAAKFQVDMGFSVEDICGMLEEYEDDYHTGMDIVPISKMIYDYTSGYPYLVSWLCKCLDEEISGRENFLDQCSVWTKAGVLEAVKLLVEDTTPLYQSMKGKLVDYPKLYSVLYDLLFTGKPVPYMAMNDDIEIAVMFGFVKNAEGTAVISNRIFETVLYNWFMSKEYSGSRIYDEGLRGRNQFIVGRHLNVRRILEKFVECFDELYGDQEESFLEDVGRRYFMLFLKPIINGTGHSYVEAETRNRERTDLVIDYCGEQFVIEMKVWRGNAYHERGEKQLSDYLDYFHLKKGYMLSFNFNKKKEIGVKDIVLGDKLLVEAVV